MIDQGYVPATCTMDDRIAGLLIYSEISAGRSPCAGCNADRSQCHGKPADPSYLEQRLSGANDKLSHTPEKL